MKHLALRVLKPSISNTRTDFIYLFYKVSATYTIIGLTGRIKKYTIINIVGIIVK